MSRAQVIRVGLVALPLLLLVSIAWAGSSDGTAMDWHVLSSGGAPAESSSGAVALNSTLGQTAIGSSSSSGATVGAGFWYGLGEGAYPLYLPVVLRTYG
jgi:hypothetical protein